jgi:hypothetical protein
VAVASKVFSQLCAACSPEGPKERWAVSMAFLDQSLRIYTAFQMADVTYHAAVWIGIVEVMPQEGCELIAPDEGAFINFLALAGSDSEFRAKVSRALSSYRLNPLEFENVRALSGTDNPNQEILSIAAELEDGRNPEHVRYATFHIYPRVM